MTVTMGTTAMKVLACAVLVGMTDVVLSFSPLGHPIARDQAIGRQVTTFSPVSRLYSTPEKTSSGEAPPNNRRYNSNGSNGSNGRSRDNNYRNNKNRDSNGRNGGYNNSRRSGYRGNGGRPAGGGGGEPALKLVNPKKVQRIVKVMEPRPPRDNQRNNNNNNNNNNQRERSPRGPGASNDSNNRGGSGPKTSWGGPSSPTGGAGGGGGGAGGGAFDKRKAAGRGKKARGGDEYKKNQPRTSLRMGTGKRGRAASLSMGRSSLKKRDRTAQRAAKAEAAIQSRTVDLPEGPVSVSALAEIIDEKPVAVIKFLMTDLGVMASMTQNLDPTTAAAVAEGFGKIVGGAEELDEDDEDFEDAEEEDEDSAISVGYVTSEDDEEDLEPRAPVVTIMGHVDHGKTSLLDALRNTRVTAGEAGGITQHIAAYQVDHAGRDITFIDTPGHAAFTDMRERGANITDIVILVVAADDGVMKQTADSIACARQAGVPVVVAINKIDLEAADPNKVKTELTQYDILTEDFGGDVLCSEISAKEGTNLDELLDKIMLQAEIQDLKANPNRDAETIVVEAKVERGLGTVATCLVKKGTLRVGDNFVAGEAHGKVRALISTNDGKTRYDEVGPSVPVRVVGFNEIPSAGDVLISVDDEQTARGLAENRQRLARERSSSSYQTNLMSSINSAFTMTKDHREMCVVVKADVQGTAEALTRALRDLKREDEEAIVTVKVLTSEAGEVNKGDIAIADVTKDTTIIAFNVAASYEASEEARMLGIPIEYYSVVYDAIESVESRMQEVLSPTPDGEFTGAAVVQEVFNIGGTGNIAGSKCTEGILRKGGNVRVLRGDKILIETTIKTLRNFKADADSIEAGNDCGIGLRDFEEFEAGDVIECFVE